MSTARVARPAEAKATRKMKSLTPLLLPPPAVWTEVRPWPLPPPADPRSAVVHALKRSSGPEAPHSGGLQLLLRQALNPQPVAQPFGSCYTIHITETQTPVLPAALFTVAKRRKPPRRPVGEWIGAVRSARAMTPFLGRTKKDVLIPGAMWMSLEHFVLNDGSYTQTVRRCTIPFTRLSGAGKPIQTEGRLRGEGSGKGAWGGAVAWIRSFLWQR